MKKVFWTFFLCSFVTYAAEKKEIKIIKAELENEKKIIAQKEKFNITITYEVPDEFILSAWAVIGYQPEVPKKCAGVFKCKKNSNPRWNSYRLQDWRWDKETEKVSVNTWKKTFTIDTARWPEGDYRFILQLLFRSKDKAGNKDTYLPVPFNVTIQ
jgi:hypothetical protein